MTKPAQKFELEQLTERLRELAKQAQEFSIYLGQDLIEIADRLAGLPSEHPTDE